jgi:hypothetical protein
MIMKKMLLIFFIFFGLFTSTVGWAATHTVTCNGTITSALQAAINAASPYDIISISSGSCSCGAVSIATQNLTIQGQGTSNTHITSPGNFFSASGSKANGLRITGIDSTGPGGTDGMFFSVSANASQVISNIRIDHNRFYHWAIATQWGTCESTAGAVPYNCVVDNNVYDSMTYSSNYVWGDCDATDSFPFTLGSAYGVYFEDNTITDTSGSMVHFITSRCGSRYVIRYNTWNVYAWDPIDMHDSTEGGGRSNGKRGSWTAEVYENKFSYNGTDKRIINFRGGQAVIFNNHYNNLQPTGGVTLQSYQIQDGNCTYHQTIGKNGAYCDEINNTYIWGNKYNCGTDMANCSSGTSVKSVNAINGFTAGVDYWMSELPGYTPYTYPHPLTGGSAKAPPGAPNAPTGLKIVQ